MQLEWVFKTSVLLDAESSSDGRKGKFKVKQQPQKNKIDLLSLYLFKSMELQSPAGTTDQPQVPTDMDGVGVELVLIVPEWLHDEGKSSGSPTSSQLTSLSSYQLQN